MAERVKVGGKWVEPLEFNPDPELACEVEYGLVPGYPKVGVIHSWMAFDARYGPEHQRQIDWHIENGTEGAETWEVGKPAKPFA